MNIKNDKIYMNEIYNLFDLIEFICNIYYNNNIQIKHFNNSIKIKIKDNLFFLLKMFMKRLKKMNY